MLAAGAVCPKARAEAGKPPPALAGPTASRRSRSPVRPGHLVMGSLHLFDQIRLVWGGLLRQVVHRGCAPYFLLVTGGKVTAAEGIDHHRWSSFHSHSLESNVCSAVLHSWRVPPWGVALRQVCLKTRRLHPPLLSLPLLAFHDHVCYTPGTRIGRPNQLLGTG